jgi:glycosyltransferase involved in cell wall biosynthesis
MEVRWTLHDCWSFTGHCSHFTFVRCDKWSTGGCHDCPQINQYPRAITDKSKKNYIEKRDVFTNVNNMTIVTPSEWLKEEVGKSFLKDYPVIVKYTNINREVFKPTPGEFRTRNNLLDKRVVLGVASKWNERKGLQDFIKLSSMLPSDYKIVLVGLDARQIKKLKHICPAILALPRTSSAGELAKMYSAADFFVNPTYEDSYPTVNLEAEACGTRVITYDTGGCRETIHRPDSMVVQDIKEMFDAITCS